MSNENEVTSEDSPSTPPPPSSSRWSTLTLFLLTLALALILVAFGYGYFQLSKINVSLAKRVTHLQEQLTTHQQQLTRLEKQVVGLAQSTQKGQALSAKQEQLITDWQAAQKGDLSRWYAVEAYQLVKLANDQLQFARNVATANLLLERASQSLQNVQDPQLADIRQSIAANIATLTAAPPVDVTALYLQLMAISQQMNQLPLAMLPLKANSAAAPPPVETTALPWWKAGLNRSLEVLRKIVVVRYNPSGAVPLVTPEEKIFLYQNLQAQVANAMWGLLHHNPAVYQASLARAMTWIQQYFDQNAPATQTMLQQLHELIKTNVQPVTVDLSATLQLFDNYFSKAPSVQ